MGVAEDTEGWYDVELLTASDQQQQQQQQQRERRPWQHGLPDGFYRGGRLLVAGCVAAAAQRFSVNLTCGAPSAGGDIVLHVNPRFDAASGALVAVVRNSRRHGVWDVEERSGVFADLRAGCRFTLAVTCYRHHFQVALHFSTGATDTFGAVLDPILFLDSRIFVEEPNSGLFF